MASKVPFRSLGSLVIGIILAYFNNYFSFFSSFFKLQKLSSLLKINRTPPFITFQTNKNKSPTSQIESHTMTYTIQLIIKDI